MIFADCIRYSKDGIYFRVNKKYNGFMPVFGLHNVYNALCAISVGFSLGFDVESLIERLESFSVPNMRMQIIQNKQRVFINDSYNSNPSSLNAAVDVLKKHFSSRRKIVVVADMLELGQKSKRFHQDAGRQIVEADVHSIVCVGKYADDIAKGAVASGMSKDKIFLCENNQGVKKQLDKLLNKNDVVLFKGSRVMRLEDVLLKYS